MSPKSITIFNKYYFTIALIPTYKFQSCVRIEFRKFLQLKEIKDLILLLQQGVQAFQLPWSKTLETEKITGSKIEVWTFICPLSFVILYNGGGLTLI